MSFLQASWRTKKVTEERLARPRRRVGAVRRWGFGDFFTFCFSLGAVDPPIFLGAGPDQPPGCVFTVAVSSFTSRRFPSDRAQVT